MTYVFLLLLPSNTFEDNFKKILLGYKGVPNEVVACTKPGVKKLKILSLQQRAQALSTDAEETLPDS
jgi:hypothetical protein